jgi:hypothetical protein
MEEAVKIVLASGKSGLDLALYTLLPVLVVMMALMKVVEARHPGAGCQDLAAGSAGSDFNCRFPDTLPRARQRPR